MKVSVYASYSHVKPSDVRGKTAIVIDVLRATTTIIQSLKVGCRIVVPVETPEDAVNYKRRNGDAGIILGGERKAEKISGFDFGNSPLEYENRLVRGKSLVLCTTNGTQAILKARDASHVIIAALCNISAAAQKAAGYEEDIAIICAGTAMSFSADDFITAGAFIERLEAAGLELSCDDLAIFAKRNYLACRQDKHKALTGTLHYEYLKSLGLKADLDFCLTEDSATIVPEFSEAQIAVEK